MNDGKATFHNFDDGEQDGFESTFLSSQFKMTPFQSDRVELTEAKPVSAAGYNLRSNIRSKVEIPS